MIQLYRVLIGYKSSHSLRACGVSTYVRVTLLTVVLALLVACAAAVPVFAAFTRPYIRQIGGTPGGAFEHLEGVTTDSLGNIWVSDGGAHLVDEFDASGGFLAQVGKGHLTGALESLAVDDNTEQLYVADSGGFSATKRVDVFDHSGSFLRELPFEGQPHVAIDNSTNPFDPAAGDVYVAEVGKHVVQRFNALGDPVNFTGSANYIEGNKLSGAPGNEPGAPPRTFGFDEPWSIATDSKGDLYVVARGGGKNREGVIEEFGPSGLFLKEINETEVPGGFLVSGNDLESVAIDSINEHILVSQNSFFGNEGTIFEFDSSGRYLDRISGIDSGSKFGSASGVAVSSFGDLYVVDGVNSTVAHNVVDEFGPGSFLPDLFLAGVASLQPTSAILRGTINPEGIKVIDCHFEYVTDETYQATGFSNLSSGGEVPCTPAATSIPADSNLHPVSAAITGLSSGVSYHFRLVATSDPTDLGGTAESAPISFVTPHKPAIDAVSATNVLASSAELIAKVNPLGAETVYQFEYVDASGFDPGAPDPYEAGTVVPATPTAIGSGGDDVSVVLPIVGLRADTTYHLRAVAHNQYGVTFGSDVTFHTLPMGEFGLPNRRAYELVTPPNKGDAEDMFGAEGIVHTGEATNFDLGYSSEDGNKFLLYTTAAFGPFPASGENGYIFSRDSSGWTYTSVASPSLGVQSAAVNLYDPINFSQVGLDDEVGSASSVPGAEVENLVGAPGGPYLALHSGLFNSEGVASLVGASSNLDKVILESPDHQLVSAASTLDSGSEALYEAAGGELHLVNINTDGSLTSRCGAILGQGNERDGGTHGAVSGDGSKVFFTAPDPRASGFHCWANEGVPPELYMRENGTTTVELSAPDPGVIDPEGMQPAIYVGASVDGSKVFFLTKTELTPDDTTHAVELYEYNTESATLTRVSRGDGGDAEGNVYDVPAISSDGSTVYFNAYGKLAPGAGGGLNLYRYDTRTGTTTFIASEIFDYPEVPPFPWYGKILDAPQVALSVQADWYTTPDGRYLLFGTTKNVTAYDSHGHTELYRYDSVGGSITCVSCNPSGIPATSDALFTRSAVRADNPAGAPPRPMSNDGSYVFFDTGESLVPQDQNGKLDVYEWHSGTISLISSGGDSSDSFFLDSSADGSNVFFGTHAQLVSEDTDNEGDLYDARIDGGFLSKGGAGPCEGDACQNPPPSPIDNTPASLVFSGPGNLLGEGKIGVAPHKKSRLKKKKVSKKKAKKAGQAKRHNKSRKPNIKRARRIGFTRKYLRPHHD